MRIAVIGAGNGGQAMAGYLAMTGHVVSLYDISREKVDELRLLGGIRLEGMIEGFGKFSCVTDDVNEAISGAQLIMVTTVANAHIPIAESMAPYLKEGQAILLNPGRTCGALVFRQTLLSCGCNKHVILGEAQTLVYACRLVHNGCVSIIGIKDEVYLAALPSRDTEHLLDIIKPAYSCFRGVETVLHTSLENIGAIFHPCVCLFNAATIERQSQFWFYRDMTERVASFIEQFDQERLAVGRAYGISLISVRDWIKVAYRETTGDTLCERMKNNPAYHDIKAPGSIFTRQLTEDIPTGVFPILELGRAAGVKTPLLESMVVIVEALLGEDFHTDGRSLNNLGLEGKSVTEIIDYVTNEA